MRVNGVTVSVGIVVHNTPLNVLKETLSSLKRARSSKIFCLCNSPDNNYQIEVKRLCEAYGVGCIPDAENRGFGAGHNAIWRRCKSEWYICCNPDVLVNENSIIKLIEYGESQKNAALLMPKVLNKDGTVQNVVRQDPTLPRWLRRQLWRLLPSAIRSFESDFNYTMTQPVEFVSGCFFAARIQMLYKIGGFDESFFLYAEDADLSRRARRIGTNWYVAEAAIVHVWERAWKKSIKSFWVQIMGLVRYWLKHGFMS